MKFETEEYVNFHGEGGFQEAICKEMGIEYNDFRRYHKVVGGEYKDLWHLYIWRVGHPHIINGGYTYFDWSEIYDDEMKEHLKEYWAKDNPMKAKEEGSEWILDFFDAIERLFVKLDKTEILIYYYW